MASEHFFVRLLLLALFSKHPDIKVTLVNRSVDKALRPKTTICLFSMIVYAQAEAVLQDDLVKARGGSNASAARSSNKNQEVEWYFRI